MRSKHRHRQHIHWMPLRRGADLVLDCRAVQTDGVGAGDVEEMAKRCEFHFLA